MATKSSPVIVLDPPTQVDKWESEDEFEARLNRIQSKVSTGEGKPKSELNIALDTDEVSKLKQENAQLKQLSEEARRRIGQLEAEAVKVLKRDADVEKMLEEKSEQIRGLQERVAEFEAKAAASTGVSEEELIALHAELERERQTLDEDRQSMEEQFRQLELSMARERAEIARERNELQRTKAELKLKLDTIEKNIQNDTSPLRRLRDELRDPSALLAPSGTVPPNSTQGMPALQGLPQINRRAPEGEDTPKRSGILSRFLGKRDE